MEFVGSCILYLLLNLLTGSRCLRPTINAQLWYLLRLLDRLRFFNTYQQLRLANTSHTAMRIHRSNAVHSLGHS